MNTKRNRRRDVIDICNPAVQEAASVLVAAIIRGDPAELELVMRQVMIAATMRWADIGPPPHSGQIYTTA